MRPIGPVALVVSFASAVAMGAPGIETEDFSDITATQSSWIVGAFSGTADIRSTSGDHLSVFGGPYDLNLNGNPNLERALVNNNPSSTVTIQSVSCTHLTLPTKA